MLETKFRIVKKEKAGVTLSPYKGGSPVKLTWEEFEKDFTVKEQVWAMPKEWFAEKLEKASDAITNAAKAFIASGMLDGSVTNEEQFVTFGEGVKKVEADMGCSNEEALMLIDSRIHSIIQKQAYKKKFEQKKEKKFEQKREKASNERFQKKKDNGVYLLADDPALLALKAQFNSKK